MHNAVSVDDCGTAVDNLCIIRAQALGLASAASIDRVLKDYRKLGRLIYTVLWKTD